MHKYSFFFCSDGSDGLARKSAQNRGWLGNWAPGGRKHWIFCDLSARNCSKSKENHCNQAEIVQNFLGAPTGAPTNPKQDDLGHLQSAKFQKEALDISVIWGILGVGGRKWNRAQKKKTICISDSCQPDPRGRYDYDSKTTWTCNISPDYYTIDRLSSVNCPMCDVWHEECLKKHLHRMFSDVCKS